MIWFSIVTLALVCIVNSQAAQPLPIDPRIASIVGDISPANIRKSVERLAAFGTRHTLSDTVSQRRGIGAARRWIKSTLESCARESNGRMTVSFDEFTAEPSGRVPHAVRLANVTATLRPEPGPVQPGERMIVIGGHYDSRAGNAMDSVGDAPGANDDGSGTALVLELARVLARHTFHATLVFVCFVGEEQGLLGAAHWAEQARQNGWKVEAMLNNDIVGNTEGGGGLVESTYVRLFSEAFAPADTGRAFARINSLGLEEDGLSRSLARYIKETGERYTPGFSVRVIYRRDRFLRGGDHTPFHQRGFAAVRFSEGAENYDRQHQNPDRAKRIGDLTEFVNERYCANVARVNAAVAATLALAPAPPGTANIVVSNLEYGTTLHWSPSPGAAGYLVRWRETTSPVWEHALAVKDTTAQLKVSKDDFLFGVQAVDEQGDASLVAVPVPERSSRPTFTNPILPAPSADPWMILYNGRYYLSESHHNAIIIRSSERACFIGRDPGKEVWRAPATGPNSDEIWAPELHHIGSRWYIYFAADDGKNENHRMWVLSSAGDDPHGPYDSCAQLSTGGWAIDGTVLDAGGGRLYFIWSGWPGSVDGMQQLYIAPMESPVRIAAERTLLSTPTEPWERQAMPIMEGPEILKHDGRTFIAYSASGSWTRHYCLGMLVNDDGQFLDPSSWKKTGPVFAGIGSVFGVGHCSFVPSPDGKEEWIVYHAKEKSTNGWEDRSVRMQRFTWDAAGYPQFGKPVAARVPVAIPSENH